MHKPGMPYGKGTIFCKPRLGSSTSNAMYAGKGSAGARESSELHGSNIYTVAKESSFFYTFIFFVQTSTVIL